jgi:hypothetical protein
MIHFYNDSGPREDWDAPIAKFVKHQLKVQKLGRNTVRPIHRCLENVVEIYGQGTLTEGECSVQLIS